MWFWLNRGDHSYSMERIYSEAGIRRQSFHEWLDRKKLKAEMLAQLLPLVRKIRKDHPGMSSRLMYELIKPEHIGRDKFIEWCNTQGFKLEVKRSPIRTTNSLGVSRFTNKIKDKEVVGPNEVWVSDITYYRIKERHYYITLIMDQYSKYIVGYHASRSLQTIDTTIPALREALEENKEVNGLILHTDGGGQYYSKAFTQLTKSVGIINSMTEDVAQNNHAERLNGTIKNQYLSYYMPTNFKELEKELRRAVKNYNESRPHYSLGRRFPQQIHNVSIKRQLDHQEKSIKKERMTINSIFN